MGIAILEVKNKEDCKEVVKYFNDFLIANEKVLKIDDVLLKTISNMRFFNADKLFEYLTNGFKVEFMKINKTIVSAVIYHPESGEVPFFAYTLIKQSTWVGRAMLEYIARKCANSNKVGFFKIKAINYFKEMYLLAGFRVTGSAVVRSGLTIIPMEFLIIQNNNER